MMKKIYVCAPLIGDVKGNIEKAIKYKKYALKCGTAPIVPHFYVLCLDYNNKKEREIGISAGLSMLWFCDELWVFGDKITKEMELEIKFCKNLNIRIRYVKQSEIDKVLGGKC